MLTLEVAGWRVHRPSLNISLPFLWIYNDLKIKDFFIPIILRTRLGAFSFDEQVFPEGVLCAQCCKKFQLWET